MIDVCEYFNIHQTTTHGAMAYLDRLQPNEKFSRFEWQMLAICCILISAKYNESEEDVPDLASLEDITQQKITNDIILSYELWALKRMGWKLGVRTVMAFLSTYTASGIIFPEDYSSNLSIKSQIEKILDKQLIALATLVTLDSHFKAIPTSILASAILFIARRNLNLKTIWNEELISLTNHREIDLIKVISSIDKVYDTLNVQVDKEVENVTINSSNLSSSPTVEGKIYLVEGKIDESSQSKSIRTSPTSISNLDSDDQFIDSYSDHILQIASV